MTIKDDLIYNEVVKYLEYDETSPTYLRLVSKTRNRKAGSVMGSLKPNSAGYLRCIVNRKLHPAHRLIYCLYNKCNIPKDIHIDHIDRDKQNNHPSNLRALTPQHNSWNIGTPSNNKSGVRGVIWHKTMNLWMVHWKVSGKPKTKSFRPDKLYPDLDYQVAIALAFNDACKYRATIEQEIFKIEEIILSDRQAAST